MTLAIALDSVRPTQSLIYGLVDPETKLVRYVGKSSSGLQRPKEHRRDPRRFRTHVANWIRGLQERGLAFEIVVLQVANPDELCELECWWIAYGRLSGWPLTNLTDGGDGAPGHRKSEDTKARIRQSNLGLKRSAETCALLSALFKGKKRSPESIAKQAATNTGRKASPETRAKISAALRGKKKSASHVANMSAALKGKPGHKVSAETKAKISIGNRGKQKSASEVARIRAFVRGRARGARGRFL